MNKSERDERWADGEGYNRYIAGELSSFRKDAWKKQICTHFSDRKGLDILDVGAGPGFFSCILSEEGHRLTGIDASEGMLACARENAEKLGVHPTLLQMDVNALTFPDESFDAVVLRNVSWTLQYPERVYAEFKRLLCPGGVLLIYDANWQLQWYDSQIRQRVLEREERYYKKYGRREVVSVGDLAYYETAPLTRIHRPEWDLKTLGDLGMDVTVTEDIGRFVYEEWEKDLYGESPLFEICAVKRARSETESNMYAYWQGRAGLWGEDYTLDELKPVADRFGRHLPAGRLRVLDVGTGPGAVACAMATLGHEVTGVDLSSNMVERARANAARNGLDVTFINTTAGELPFADDSFDVVTSRELVWALPEPEETFKQWQRVLKPGGLVVYADGNHYLYQTDEKTWQDRQLVLEKTGTVHPGAAFDPSLCDETAKTLPLSKLNRPWEWDEKALPALGFDIIAEEISMPQKLLRYGIYDRGFYTTFLIAAKNAKGLDN